MMKKVLYGVALTLLASASVGSLQSCKDDVNDLKTQTSYDLSQIKADLSQVKGDLAKRAKLAYVNKLIFGLENYDQEVNGSNPDFADIESKGGLYAMIKGAYDAIFPENLPEDAGIDDKNMIDYLKGRVNANKAAVDAILKFLDGYIPEYGVEGSEVPDQQEPVYRNLFERLTEMQEQIAQNTADITTLSGMLLQIEEALNMRLDNLITSIKVERAISPVFGDLSLPIGIKSNILFNWYGLSDNGDEVPFPTAMAGLVGEGVTLPAGAPSENIAALYGQDAVELGNVYVTLNPVGHVFNGTELTFTTSAGNNLDFKVKLTPSEYELKHGYTRADEAEDASESEIAGNGFYEGQVTVPYDQIESIKLSIDDKLMSAMKNAVKDQTKRNAAALIKAIYDQMSGLMPAYALRYDWTSPYYKVGGDNSGIMPLDGSVESAINWNGSVEEKPYAVLSGYDLAVAAARPLGFNFLKGEGASSNKVPTIGNLDNFVQELIDKNLDKINIQGKDMEVLGHKIGFAKGEVSIVTVNEKLVATVSGVTVDGKALGDVKTEGYTAPEETSAYINKALSKAIAEVIDGKSPATDETQAKVEASVDIALLQMQKQINEVLADVNGQIHNAFDGISDSANSYLDKAQRAIDLYNKVANKINNFFKDPNHYLQAAVFYKTSDNIGILSSNPNSPTVFKGNGNAITLYLSTYSGEIIAPAYKKYVAVTTPGFSNSGKLNTVLDGSEIAVEVPVAGFESGKVYEIVYQAVDYRGFYSTRKCYVKVEK